MGITGKIEGLKKKEILINSSLEKKVSGESKLYIKDPWLRMLEEKDGITYFVEKGQQVDNENYFDKWSEFENKTIQGSTNFEADKLRKMSKWFISCKKADVWIIGNPEYQKTFNSSGQTYWWTEKEENWEIQEVDTELLKSTSFKVELDSQIKNIENLCERFKEDLKFSIPVENKLKQMKDRKGNIVNIKLGEGVIKTAASSDNNEERKSYLLGGVIYEKEKVNGIRRKVRIVHIEQGNNLFYVDEWVEPIKMEQLKDLKYRIEKSGKCKISSEFEEDDEEGGNECNGVILMKELVWNPLNNGENQKENEKWKVFTNNNWSNNDLGSSYGNKIQQDWEYFSQEITTKYVWWRREVGITWDGRTFKWRSF